MNASELRLGNYVCVKNDIISIVRNIHRSKVYIEYDLDCQFKRRHSFLVKNVKPIPITEEWLLKFGFEKVRIDYTFSHCYHYQDEYCWVYLIPGGFEFELIVGKDRFNLMRTYEFVHQLQNLYFILTGQELTLK